MPEPIDLANLRRLHEAATQGEWEAPEAVGRLTRVVLAPDGQAVAAGYEAFPGTAQANATLIAAAHNALPTLLEIAEAADAYLTAQTDIQFSWRNADPDEQQRMRVAARNTAERLKVALEGVKRG
jgi:hypothetical protein